jgi:hypothetical protein
MWIQLSRKCGCAAGEYSVFRFWWRRIQISVDLQQNYDPKRFQGELHRVPEYLGSYVLIVMPVNISRACDILPRNGWVAGFQFIWEPP